LHLVTGPDILKGWLSKCRKTAMSKGHGRLQRQLLAALSEHSKLDTLALAQRAYRNRLDSELTESQLVSVRQALRRLARDGLIFDLGRRKEDRIREWANERYGLFVMIRKLQKDISISRQDSRVQTEVELLQRYLQRAEALGVDVHSPWPPVESE
jgi:hypothetical protein